MSQYNYPYPVAELSMNIGNAHTSLISSFIATLKALPKLLLYYLLLFVPILGLGSYTALVLGIMENMRRQRLVEVPMPSLSKLFLGLKVTVALFLFFFPIGLLFSVVGITLTIAGIPVNLANLLQYFFFEAMLLTVLTSGKARAVFWLKQWWQELKQLGKNYLLRKVLWLVVSTVLLLALIGILLLVAALGRGAFLDESLWTRAIETEDAELLLALLAQLGGFLLIVFLVMTFFFLFVSAWGTMYVLGYGGFPRVGGEVSSESGPQPASPTTPIGADDVKGGTWTPSYGGKSEWTYESTEQQSRLTSMPRGERTYFIGRERDVRSSFEDPSKERGGSGDREGQ